MIGRMLFCLVLASAAATASAQEPACKLYKVSAGLLSISKAAGRDIPIGSLENGDVACVTRQQSVNGDAWGYISLRLEKPNMRAPINGWAMLRDMQELSPTEAVDFAAVVARPAPTPPPASWKRYTYAADGFEIEFPGTVKVTPTNISEQAKQRIVRSTDYLQDTWDFKYFVAATLFKQTVDFDEGVRANFARLKCSSASPETPISVASGRARELRGTNCLDGSSSVETRFFATGKWFYQVIAVFKKEGGDTAAARHFVQSFKLIKQ